MPVFFLSAACALCHCVRTEINNNETPLAFISCESEREEEEKWKGEENLFKKVRGIGLPKKIFVCLLGARTNIVADFAAINVAINCLPYLLLR